jgi:hypothetical protein
VAYAQLSAPELDDPVEPSDPEVTDEDDEPLEEED